MVRTTALLLAVLVACSGCLAVDSPGTGTTEGTGTTTATSTTGSAPTTLTTGSTTPAPTTATTATTDTTTGTPSYNDCPYYLSVEVAGDDPDARDEAVVAYADLAEPRRAEFDRALRKRTVELGREPNGWVDRRFVRKGGVVHRTGVMVC